MTNTNKVKSIEIGDVHAKAAHFIDPQGNPNHRYIVLAEQGDYVAFLNTYCVGEWDNKRADGINLDGSEKNFYLVAVADCYDPPVTIVRANNEGDALEQFADETTWAHISEPDLADYDEESLSYNSNGIPYETDNIVIRKMKLSAVELA